MSRSGQRVAISQVEIGNLRVGRQKSGKLRQRLPRVSLGEMGCDFARAVYQRIAGRVHLFRQQRHAQQRQTQRRLRCIGISGLSKGRLQGLLRLRKCAIANLQQGQMVGGHAGRFRIRLSAQALAQLQVVEGGGIVLGFKFAQAQHAPAHADLRVQFRQSVQRDYCICVLIGFIVQHAQVPPAFGPLRLFGHGLFILAQRSICMARIPVGSGGLSQAGKAGR